MFSEPCFRDIYTANIRQKRGMTILSMQFGSNLSGVIGGQADMYPWSELLEIRQRIRQQIKARKAGSNSDIVKVGVDTY